MECQASHKTSFSWGFEPFLLERVALRLMDFVCFGLDKGFKFKLDGEWAPDWIL